MIRKGCATRKGDAKGRQGYGRGKCTAQARLGMAVAQGNLPCCVLKAGAGKAR